MSLVTTPAHQLATCTHCTSSRVIRIGMTLTDGSVVDFVSCLRCERKSWTQGGSDLSVTDVLQKAKKPVQGSVPQVATRRARATAQ
jgi:hypothetical protein